VGWWAFGEASVDAGVGTSVGTWLVWGLVWGLVWSLVCAGMLPHPLADSCFSVRSPLSKYDGGTTMSVPMAFLAVRTSVEGVPVTMSPPYNVLNTCVVGKQE